MQRKPKQYRLDRTQTQRGKRPAWRQRLVQAERGISNGVRGDSTFFVHFFIASIILAAGVVVGLGSLQWGLVTLALTVVFSAEMFNQVVKVILQEDGQEASEEAKKALGISTAAVSLTILGALITLTLIFGQRIMEMFNA